MHQLIKTPALAAMILSLTFTLGAGHALAEKPEWAGGGKHGHKDKDEKHGNKKGDRDDRKHASQDKQDKRERREVRVGGYFDDRDRRQVRVAYDDNYGRGGKGCPPGLAKKNNGCMPPGQAKKYNVGQPLPSDVVYYPLPPALIVKLPPVPAGHKYVRVAADILLIAVGTSMVVDAMTDLGRL